ncbi:MAG: ATP-grasp domain-containing protein [Deltaproteobacteria bacterium]|jgi:pyrrolysine biosynthesis protein PylC|nr:ATP-grasp domain-containing protein [Deltaproteobacteria bacterium]
MTFKALVAGGGLQGVEALYLARKAGWRTRLCDRRLAPPALGLADGFARLDLGLAALADLQRLGADCDALVPALEDRPVLERLAQASAEGRLPPMLFDPAAYRVSSSKLLSKRLFQKLGLPAAEDWRPEAVAPQGRPDASAGPPELAYVAKPSGLSGSRGVSFFAGSRELLARFPTPASRRGWVIERRMEGPSYSVEVTARRGRAQSWQVTALEMDEAADCRAVVAPSGLAADLELELKKMAERLAEALNLTGLMDLEAILENGSFKLLEIDARLPSQTPTAVYWSTGVNLLEELAAVCLGDEMAAGKGAGKDAATAAGRRSAESRSAAEGRKNPDGQTASTPKRTRYEHVLSLDGVVSRHGERLMAGMGPLTLVENFMGAQEALVGGHPGGRFFVATLINVQNPA